MEEPARSLEGTELRARRRRSSLLLGFAAIVPALAYAAFTVSRGVGINLFEDGTSIVGGLRIFDGQVPYRDFFAFYGPLTYVLPAAAFRVTGSVVTGITGYYTVISCVTSLVAYGLVRRMSGKPVASLAAPVALVLLNATTARSLLAMTGVLALMAYERTGRSRWMLVAGVCLTGALLWIQDSGAWFAAALLVIWVCGLFLPAVRRVLNARSVGLVALGALVAAAPWLILTVAGRFTGDWLYWSYIFPNTTYTNRNTTGYLSGLVRSWNGESLPALGYHVIFYLLPYVAVFAIAAVNIAAAATRLRRIGSATVAVPASPAVPVGSLVLAVYGLFQLRILAASLDDAKLADSLAPTIVCAFGLALATMSFPRHLLEQTRWWTAAVGVLGLVWLTVWPLQHAAHFLSTPVSPVKTMSSGTLGGLPITGGNPPSSTPAELVELRDEVSRMTTPGGSILVLPTSPMVYAITGRPNATRYDYLDPVYTTTSVDKEIATAVRDQLPEVVVVGDNDFPSGPSGPEIAPRTYAAIMQSYTPAATIGQWTVYKRVAA